MQEQVDEKTVAITVKATKLTGQLLAKAMKAVLNKSNKPSKQHVKHGKQSIKSLSKQGVSLIDIKIDGTNIGSFNKIARKYNVDYALKKDITEEPPKWYVFFKAKDSDSLMKALKEYTRTHIKHEKEKPSLLDALAKTKDLVKQTAPPVKNRSIGGHEL